ncbi:MAG: hypothetical protein A2606_02755 [Candidatus Yanofskybacteria bacterium RIFOXYD1_FULL_42_10]|uniref:Uncharacterized protein n=1 Tax=Candidatus Yanofskybacteria bacterium RIFOXYD1_FULL_42_10 TaxID=1802718 RepID=A0A1F8HVW7_9BACT|nr:MAG: hypothetical protein A2606_02755 [Candidatus Yanofskybacteria bacterium RIFOXYD1_FULL_42_10]
MNFRLKMLSWIIIFVAGIGLIVFSSVLRDQKPFSIISPAPSVSALLSPSPIVKTPFPSKAKDKDDLFKGIPDQRLAPTSVPSGQITGPATCQLVGSINFLEKNLYENKDAKITYQNIDSPARLVLWKILPDDGDLKIGPNIFSGLPLPNGERSVGVSVLKDFLADSYNLTATVSYGVTDSRGVEKIYYADCTGSITVIAPPK